MQREMWFQVKQLTASRNGQFKTYEEGKYPGQAQTSEWFGTGDERTRG